MGIIRAVTSAVGGGLADQWLEVIQPDNMSDSVVMTTGTAVRPKDARNQNTKGTAAVISNGSIIQIEVNQCMMLVDGGKIVDYSAEPGYYKVDNSASPSLFSGGFGDSLKETFNRVRYGGVTPYSQKAVYINTQEIKNITFGTVNPINYFDNFYNAELYLRAHGYFSIRIIDPLKFYAEAIPRNAERVDINDIHKLYLSEFLTALQTAIGQMSVDGIRVSHVTAKGRELSQYLSTVLDEEWTEKRGMLIESVGIASIAYDEDSRKLIEVRSKGAMLSDPVIREGYVQGSVARGIEAAGSNSAGSAQAFMGMGMGMQQGGGFVAAASQSNQFQQAQQAQAAQQPAQIQQPAAEPAPPAPVAAQGQPVPLWACPCGAKASGKFCPNCGTPRPEGPAPWTCRCGQSNNSRFCISCGQPKPLPGCPRCSKPLSPGSKFCGECGLKL